VTAAKWTPSGKLGLAMTAVFIVLGIVGPYLAPFDPAHGVLAARFAPPSLQHWLGTDAAGVDALSQLLYGARAALVIGASVVGISSVFGLMVGALAGWFGGVFDELVMRIVDVLLAFPGILLNIAIVASVAHPSVGVMIAALAINGWVGYARVARGQVLALREREFVVAALALGAGHRHMILRHIAPNLVAPALVQLSFAFGGIILVEASLSFLGLGPQIDYTWGAMLEQGTTFLWRGGFTHYAIAPGLAVTWVVLGANLLGDGLRDRLDPKRRA
jgi:peptide/nickel transport system permease protein